MCIALFRLWLSLAGMDPESWVLYLMEMFSWRSWVSSLLLQYWSLHKVISPVYSLAPTLVHYLCCALIAAVVDIVLSWKARRSMSFYVKLRYILKAVSAAGWVVILPITYAYSLKNPAGFAQTIKSWFGNSPSSPSLFVTVILVYLAPNMLSVLLFLFPFIRRFLERSNNKILMLIMWWSQVCRTM